MTVSSFHNARTTTLGSKVMGYKVSGWKVSGPMGLGRAHAPQKAASVLGHRRVRSPRARQA